jgi:hypothetical protein
MKPRWKVLLGAAAVVTMMIATPIFYVETQCRAPLPILSPASSYRSLLTSPADQRPEARTWLTYPEWYIVYSAESFARYLRSGPPSGFGYGRNIAGFWTGYCALNRATAGSRAAGDAKVMIYTIGISYSVELALKAAYENTVGRLFEWIGGWHSADDTYAAAVQARYGAFMHETPWYAFPFGAALKGEWQTNEPHAHVRHWERRGALSLEYGVKAGYAKLIGWASGTALGQDERLIRIVVRATPSMTQSVDPRLRIVGALPGGLLVVEAPRYAQFTELLGKLAASPVQLVEIAGNDDILITALTPVKAQFPAGATPLLHLALDDRPGWERVGLAVKVRNLLPLIRNLAKRGDGIEHVYDY